MLEPERLGRRVRSLLPESEVWISPVSVWELVLLLERGRVHSPYSAAKFVEITRQQSNCREAHFVPEVALEAAGLSLPHRDPADRLLLATARYYGLVLVTADKMLLSLPEFACQPNS